MIIFTENRDMLARYPNHFFTVRVSFARSRTLYRRQSIQVLESLATHHLIPFRIFADAVLDAIYVSALCVDGYFSESSSPARGGPLYSPMVRRVRIKVSGRVRRRRPDASCRYLYVYPVDLFRRPTVARLPVNRVGL